MVLPFLMAVCILSFILYVIDFYSLKEEFISSVNFITWLKISFYILLEKASLILPMGFLFSCLVSLSQLSNQNEIVAVKSAGVNPIIFLKPLVFVSILFCVLCFIIAGFLEPVSYKNIKYIFTHVIESKNVTLLKEGIFNENFFHYIIYVEKIDKREGQLNNVVVIKNDESSKTSTNIIFAKRGYIHKQLEPLMIILQLEGGTYHLGSEDFKKVDFQKAHIKFEHANKWIMGREAKKKDIVSLFNASKKDSSAYLELHKKTNLSLASVFFALFAFGFWGILQRMNRGISFLAMLVVLFGYYLSYIVAERFSSSLSHFEIGFIMALPNFFLLILSLFFIYWAHQR